MKLKFSITAFILTMFFASAASAQKKTVGASGTEIPLHQQSDAGSGNSCYVYRQYVVTTVSSEDVGEDINVYKRSNTPSAGKECAIGNRRPYMILKNDDDNFFYGLTGDKILIDSGTSAGERGLKVASLTSKKVIYSTSYKGSVKVAGDAIIYDKPSGIKGSIKNCPNARKWRKQGGSEGWVRSTRLDLTTLKEAAARSLQCVYVE